LTISYFEAEKHTPKYQYHNWPPLFKVLLNSGAIMWQENYKVEGVQSYEGSC